VGKRKSALACGIRPLRHEHIDGFDRKVADFWNETVKHDYQKRHGEYA
jgi:hypothetical protein